MKQIQRQENFNSTERTKLKMKVNHGFATALGSNYSRLNINQAQQVRRIKEVAHILELC